jgi:hypothetical protein
MRKQLRKESSESAGSSDEADEEDNAELPTDGAVLTESGEHNSSVPVDETPVQSVES